MSKNRVCLGFVLILLIFSMACRTINLVSQRASDAQGTVESAVTVAVQLATVGGPLLKTANALATEVPGLKETAVALITENPALVNTVLVVVTQGINLGTAPQDVPIVDQSTMLNFIAAETLVSYATSIDYQSVVEFYKTEMPANGWEADPSRSIENTNTTTLSWFQLDRQAIVIITINPADNSTVVVITIKAR